MPFIYQPPDVFQISQMTAAQVSALTGQELMQWGDDLLQAIPVGLMQYLTYDDAFLGLAAVTWSTTPARIWTFTAAQLKGLSTAQVHHISAADIESLNATSIQNVPAALLNEMTSRQFQEIPAAAMAGLSAQQLNNLNKAHLDWLTVDQYGSIPHNIRTGNQPTDPVVPAERAIQAEIENLPQSFQTALNTLLQDPGLAVFANPNLSSVDLALSSTVGAAGADLNSFITLYDNNEAQLGLSGSAFSALNAFYQNAVDREGLNVYANNTGELANDVSDMFSWLNNAHNELVIDAPPATGTDLIGYCETLDSELGDETGKFTGLIEDLTQIGAYGSNLQALAVDPVTGTTFSSGILQYILDGTSAITDQEGAISYGGQTDLTFSEALQNATLDLFNEADTFVKTADANLDQVIKNQSLAAEKSLISDILDVIGGLASVGAGLSKLAIASAGSDIPKTASELGSTLGNVITGLNKETSDWLKGSTGQGSSQVQYNNLSDTITDIQNALTQYGIPDGDKQAEMQFISDYTALVVNIDNHLQQGVTNLGVSNTLGSNYGIGPAYALLLPTNSKGFVLPSAPITVSYVDFFGNSHTTQINLAALLSGQNWGGGSDNETVTLAGPATPGYASTQWTFSYSENRSSAVETIQLKGYNPV